MPNECTRLRSKQNCNANCVGSPDASRPLVGVGDLGSFPIVVMLRDHHSRERPRISLMRQRRVLVRGTGVELDAMAIQVFVRIASL